MTKATLEILIGDDLFADPMISRSVKRCLEPLKEKITAYQTTLTYASTPREVTREAQKGTYDIIVTDLDYGTTGRVGTEGFDILESIAQMQLPKKPFIILCTSQDHQQEAIQKRLDEKKVHALVGPGSSNKFQALSTYLINKYSPQRAPAEGDTPLQSEGGEEE